VLRKLLLYATMIGLLVAGVAALLSLGSRLEPPAAAPAQREAGAPAAAAPGGEETGVLSGLIDRVREPFPLLLLQVVTIVVAARLLGTLFGHLGQPPVIGEMVAGVLLGPSLLGWVWPAAHAALFPPASLEPLRLLSQIGVVLFLFVVGIDVDVAHLRARAGAAIWVSHASIAAPLLLGTAFSLVVYRTLAPAGTPFSPFALFIGVAMSITAFPVLARILEERGLARTALGATAITCAAVGDVTAWCLLALVVALATAEALAGAAVTALLTLAFTGLVLYVARPLARRLIRPEVGGELHQKAFVAGALSFVFLCALTTEAIGIHALFGAFLAGVAMPRHPSVLDYLRKRIEALGSVVLLPLFFAFTGLRTEIGLLADARSWLICAGVIAVAVAGKLGGSMLAARVTGMSWPDSFALGALMNTRGLIELIVLGLGYDLGILSPQIFAMMVLMALVTTLMTGPLLQVWAALRRRETAAAKADAAA
jgi:Kef-type K+ transport system membrane component KefB